MALKFSILMRHKAAAHGGRTLENTRVSGPMQFPVIIYMSQRKRYVHSATIYLSETSAEFSIDYTYVLSSLRNQNNQNGPLPLSPILYRLLAATL